MTVLAMTLPLARSSPIRISRRDIVVDPGDALTLRLTIVDADTPDAAPVDLWNASVRMLFWHRRGAWDAWDYGGSFLTDARNARFWLEGSIADEAAGRADVTLSPGLAQHWPQRMGYTLQITGGAAGGLTSLAWGMVEMPRVDA